MGYFRGPASARVQAIPGAGADVEVWMLGSSLFGAQVAAALGLPFAFAAHFAPRHLAAALDLYRSLFRPSARLAAPHVMVCVNAIVAETDTEARRLATSLELAFLSLRRGRPAPLPPPVDPLRLSPEEQAMLDELFSASFVGAPAVVRAGLEQFLSHTGADELIVSAHIHGTTTRRASGPTSSSRADPAGPARAGPRSTWGRPVGCIYNTRHPISDGPRRDPLCCSYNMIAGRSAPPQTARLSGAAPGPADRRRRRP
jgi:luciferase family oxidoreductase group 1